MKTSPEQWMNRTADWHLAEAAEIEADLENGEYADHSVALPRVQAHLSWAQVKADLLGMRPTRAVR